MSAPTAVGVSVASVILLLMLMAGAALSAWLAWLTAIRLRQALRRGEGWLRVLPWAILLPIAVLFAGGMIYFIASLVIGLASYAGS